MKTLKRLMKNGLYWEDLHFNQNPSAKQQSYKKV